MFSYSYSSGLVSNLSLCSIIHSIVIGGYVDSCSRVQRFFVLDEISWIGDSSIHMSVYNSMVALIDLSLKFWLLSFYSRLI
jgi:hypothetical protein